MACGGCNRRKQNIVSQIQNGLRMSADLTSRIKRQLNIGATGQPAKYDNIRLTSEGVYKDCSQCSKSNGPGLTASHVPGTECENCK